MFNREKFADLIIKAIDYEHRSLNQYALECGVSSAHISRLSRGILDTAPGPDTIKKLADKAHNNVTYNELMEAAGHIPGSKISEESGEYYEKSIIAPYPTTGDPMDDLPPEALKEIEEFRAYVRHKYKGYNKNQNK